MPRVSCPNCNSSDGLAMYNDGAFCFSCQTKSNGKQLIKTPHTSTQEMPLELGHWPLGIKNYLAQYYISAYASELHELYKIGWSTSYSRLVFPINEQAAWLRSLDRSPKWLYWGDKKAPLFESKDKPTYPSDVLCIVEDCISAIRVGDVVKTLSLGGTNTRKEALVEYLVWNTPKTIITWFDGDKAGQTAAKKFRERYKLMYNIKNILTEVDPKCFPPSQINDIITNVLDEGEDNEANRRS